MKLRAGLPLEALERDFQRAEDLCALCTLSECFKHSPRCLVRIARAEGRLPRPPRPRPRPHGLTVALKPQDLAQRRAAEGVLDELKRRGRLSPAMIARTLEAFK
ncbi:MAG TPA: hypothetical protein VK422_16945 [Pyrinomonadaceae bacterium]|nr:hypothetical protein [Pyrinomonadaceae bacterium]